MNKKHMKRCSTLLIMCCCCSVAKSCLILCDYSRNANQNAMSHHLISQNSHNQKLYKQKCYRGCGEKGTLLHCWWKCKLVQPLWRTVWRFLKKTKNRTTIWYFNLTTGQILGENHNFKRYRHPNIHCSTIYNGQDMEATEMFTDRTFFSSMLNGQRRWGPYIQWNITQPSKRMK